MGPPRLPFTDEKHEAPRMYQFALAAITNYYKLRNLKQCNLPSYNLMELK
jgi:hypothetical protein